jgi:UDPglucose 6-dehydrogenase
MVREGLDTGRLRFVVGAAEAVVEAEFVFLCVPTPKASDGSADMSFIEAAAREIAPVLKVGSIVLNKSTVPVGSARVVERALGREDVFVVSNPEFLREGAAVHDFLNPDRIVIGCEDQRAAIRVGEIFKSIKAPFVVTDPASAETIKYASNAFLATKISYINAIEFLRPGPGYGGSCFPKDTQALVNIADQAGYDFSLLKGVIAVNEEQQQRIVAKVAKAVGNLLEGARIAVWGLTFKARTDDLRDSPALAIVERLTKQGADVHAYDPTVREPLPGMTTYVDPYEACEGAKALLILTEWDEFRWLDLAMVRTKMDGHCIVDARNILEPGSARRAGLSYEGVGLS